MLQRQIHSVHQNNTGWKLIQQTFFNSSFKRTVNVTATGGLLEFSPGITFTDSTVYYWRVSPIDGAGNPSKWNEASFVYLPNSDVGFNQSHFYQHTKSFSKGYL